MGLCPSVLLGRSVIVIYLIQSPAAVAAMFPAQVQDGCRHREDMMTTPPGAFGDYQLEIYGAGLRGVLPAFPMAFAELEARAAQALSPSVLSYVAGGAGSEHTQRANVSAFRQWGLIPRMFVGAARRDLSVDLFGMRLPSPVLMAPIGVIGLCAQDRAWLLATAAAAARYRRPDDRLDAVRRSA